ncbi:hypothetical protein M2322_003417 [Rhodoblastus acidophilus]|uniref:hypothetical protein n=1 Tax=Rhodoblastus acidophilus TaxID=1074 RepID=UPI0022247CC5|nr:hypothetical protein [Rhodoblastus acidophilus]MCW2317852.1 hypothetical protein [Rhodoblastus acidophilus]
MQSQNEPGPGADGAEADRRKFLASLGRFSVVTPPAITLLLSTTLTSEAIAQSGASHGHHPHGWGSGRDHHWSHHHHHAPGAPPWGGPPPHGPFPGPFGGGPRGGPGRDA